MKEITYIHIYKMRQYGHVLWILLCIIQLEKSKSTQTFHNKQNIKILNQDRFSILGFPFASERH